MQARTPVKGINLHRKGSKASSAAVICWQQQSRQWLISTVHLPRSTWLCKTTIMSKDSGTPKMTMPQGNDNVLEKAAAPIATISSHADPWPHYLMSGACGLSAAYTYSTLNNPRMAGIKAALGVAYLWAGRQLVTGNPQTGYDVGSIASLALLGVAGPRAQATQEMSAVAMSALGGVSAISNIIKSYEMRTGKPKEMGYERS